MKAKIYIKYNGKTYSPTGTWKCSSKRDCDLFKHGVCDDACDRKKYPCGPLMDAFDNFGCAPSCGLKEVAE